ncbi:FMN-binding negative transcriptional regulator [Actimicrobium sp. CCI2.3]|uniref:FMN-binding negative transcriptional regulator n=1 Tax=Actimicrobium sp. CCI2.3 TaxID=3048616 RepID=UPI002AB3B6B2|nr:FMN-binding negative transcriptional regulator [Actimicrobium sp. CCI2.3]MDY7573818.1 FMN-binding negative transcriptional regulator [Actimicrobium sp. CCI2.3]MEB0022429.1 FMN-binding negative transcriptional regulator [Actimicrobium sp. CCI2.3]
MPQHFREDDPALLLEVMQRYPFATLVSNVDGKLFATHVPVLARQVDGAVRIDGHVARANPHWQALQADPAALVIFQGPHTYISPTRYVGKNRVPTWNYIAVHASGTALIEHDVDAKLALLASLVEQNEPGYHAQFDQLDTGLREGLLKAIVGFTIRVDQLEGKFKLGQHRLAEDQPDMQAWHEAGGENERAIAQWMQRLGHWA